METASTRYFPESVDLKADLNVAFELWDAVCEGVASAQGVLPEASKKVWVETAEWLAARR